MVHALQLKQQQQGWLSYLNHISIDVMIDELPRVHSDALQLKQQAMLLIDFNQPSLQPQVLSSELLLIDQLRRVHQDVLRQQRQTMLLLLATQPSLQPQVLSSELLLIDQLRTCSVHQMHCSNNNFH
jgi:hypothetical protein